MSEEFFERLDKKAAEKIADTTVLREVFKYPSVRYSSEVMVDLAKQVKLATIEALKEMMVGEPIKGYLCHVKYEETSISPYEEKTWIQAEPGVRSRGLIDDEFDGLHGTDGEEVEVLVVHL